MFNEPTSGASVIDRAVELKSRAVAMLAMNDEDIVTEWRRIGTHRRRKLTEWAQRDGFHAVADDPSRAGAIRAIVRKAVAS